MEEAVEPLKESQYFVSWLASLGKHLERHADRAPSVTVVVQSSSATLGMVISLASQQLISLTAAIAVLLGAELGTCADTLLAFHRPQQSSRAHRIVSPSI
jgi:phosphate:Na+ symporter